MQREANLIQGREWCVAKEKAYSTQATWQVIKKETTSNDSKTASQKGNGVLQAKWLERNRSLPQTRIGKGV